MLIKTEVAKMQTIASNTEKYSLTLQGSNNSTDKRIKDKFNLRKGKLNTGLNHKDAHRLLPHPNLKQLHHHLDQLHIH